MSILHLSRKWAWISISATGTDNQVCPMRDSRLQAFQDDIVFIVGFKKYNKKQNNYQFADLNKLIP
jgi:hypothetical protein